MKRRVQKEHAHEELIAKADALTEQKLEVARQIDTAGIQKKEQQLILLEMDTKEKDAAIAEASKQSTKMSARLEERECDNYYLNFLEYEK